MLAGASLYRGRRLRRADQNESAAYIFVFSPTVIAEFLDQSDTDQSDTDQSVTGQSGAGQSGTGQSGTGQSVTEKSVTEKGTAQSCSGLGAAQGNPALPIVTCRAKVKSS